MTPDRVSKCLCRIAAYIDTTKNPDRETVRKAVINVIAAVTREDRIKRIAKEIRRLAIEQVELDLWDDTDEGQALLRVIDNAVKAEKADDINAALQATKGRIDDFIEVLENSTFEDPKEGSDLDSLYEDTVKKKNKNFVDRAKHNAPRGPEKDVDLSDLDTEELSDEFLQAAGINTKRLRTKRS